MPIWCAGCADGVRRRAVASHRAGPGREVFEATGPVLIAAAGPGRAGN